jgi:hypothetical protein
MRADDTRNTWRRPYRVASAASRGRTPLDAAMTELGARQVEEVLERGLHGLPV